MACGAEHHGKVLWGAASTWKMSGVSKRSSFHCQQLYQTTMTVEVAIPGDTLSGRTPSEMSHDEKMVLNPTWLHTKSTGTKD